MRVIITIFLLSLIFGQLPSLLPVLNLPIFVHDIFLVILLFASGVALIRRKKIYDAPLIKPTLTFIAVVLVSLSVNLGHVGSGQLSYAGLYLGRWIAYALVYFVVIQKLVPAKTWLKGLYAFGTALAILGILQFIFYPSLANLRYLGWDPYYYRLFSTLFDPNFTGLILALTVFLGFSFARRPLAKLIFCQMIIAVALFLTFSRSAYLAFFVGLGVYGFFTKSWKLVFGFLLSIVIFITIPKPGFEAFNLMREVSSVARFNNWLQSFNLFLFAPIFGHGFNLLAHSSSTNVPSHAGAGVDNSFLFILDTAGLVGLLVIFYFAVKLIKPAQKLLKKKETRSLGITFLASLTALALHSLFNNSLFYPWTAIWLWILLGVVELTAGK